MSFLNKLDDLFGKFSVCLNSKRKKSTKGSFQKHDNFVTKSRTHGRSIVIVIEAASFMPINSCSVGRFFVRLGHINRRLFGPNRKLPVNQIEVGITW